MSDEESYHFWEAFYAEQAEQAKQANPAAPSRFVPASFLRLMEDIGRLGYELKGAQSIEARAARGETPRDERHTSQELYLHSRGHFERYLEGIPNEHFGTRGHQLAAVAYNAVLEFILAGLEDEPAAEAEVVRSRLRAEKGAEKGEAD